MRLAGKVALVTGAGSGIGKATSMLLAREGARVGLLCRDPQHLQEIRSEIESFGGEAYPIVADVSSPEQMCDAYRRMDDLCGRLDIVFANAGINGVWAPLEELEPEEWDRTLRVNLTGTFLTVKYALPMLKRQGGSIIIDSSINGTRVFSNTGATAYACSKGAQQVFAYMIGLELAPHRIRTNVICPGSVQTAIDQSTQRRHLDHLGVAHEFPEGDIPLTGARPATAEQVARLVLFLASDDSDHITGTSVFIDGGQSLLQG